MTTDADDTRLADALAEIERLRARLRDIEAQFARTCGTLATPTADVRGIYTHNLPPSAPPHDEQP